MRKAAGFTILAGVFGGIFAITAKLHGLAAAIFCFGFVIALVGLVFLAFYLIIE